MKILHAKSPCCVTSIRRFGGRRRQCLRCLRTWRIRKKRRGRKQKRLSLTALLHLLLNGETLRQYAKKSRCTPSALQKRICKTFSLFLKKYPLPPIPKDPLIVILDGLWLRLNGKKYTLYLIILRPIHTTRAYLLDPVLLPGKERASDWNQILEKLPETVTKRIQAVIMDGLPGCEEIAAMLNCPLQRCHAHLLRMFLLLRGRRTRFTIDAPDIRESVYKTIYRFLKCSTHSEAADCLQTLASFMQHPQCPRSIHKKIRGLLLAGSLFRTYRHFPHFNLPTTTNSIESVCSQLRNLLGRARGFKNTTHLLNWATAFVRLHPSITCNGWQQSGHLSTKFRH